MKVVNELLGVPGIKIYQDTETFNFSVDAFLLASFPIINYKVKKIVDLCTGNAPVALYLSLRSKSDIIAVEVQEKSYQLAVDSVKLNGKENQIKVLNDNLINIHKKIGQDHDLVVVNPPFFKCHTDSNLNKNDYLTIARHEVLCTLDDVCKEAGLLLKHAGTFCMVHRPDRLTDILETLRKNRLEPKRLRFVYPKLGTECNHIIIEAKKNGNPAGLKILPPLVVHLPDGSYTKEILDMFNLEGEL